MVLIQCDDIPYKKVQNVLANSTAVTPSSGIDLRTGSLAGSGRWQTSQRLVQHCLVALLSLMVITIMGMYNQTNTLKNHLADINQERLNTYRQVIDADTLPPGAAMRIASERIRLEGL